jgi:acetyl esterase/lipase
MANSGYCNRQHSIGEGAGWVLFIGEHSWLRLPRRWWYPISPTLRRPPRTIWLGRQMTHAARDAAYNNSAAVSDSAQIVDRWVAASAAFRSQRPQHLDLAYGPGERNKWDLFLANNPTAPCLVFIHGGYWQSRSREHFSCFAEGVLARGWSAALPGFTLAPNAALTQIVGEVRSALDWLAGQGGARHYRGCDHLGLVSRWASHCAIAGPSQCTGGPGDLGDF